MERTKDVAEATVKLWQVVEDLTDVATALAADADTFALAQDIMEARRQVFRAYDKAETVLAVLKSL